MKKTTLGKISSLILALGLALALSEAAVAKVGVQWMDVRYLYGLADFSGPIKTFQSRLAVARKAKEVFVYDYAQKDIRVFDEHGMEIFRMGEDNEFAASRDFVVTDEGELYVLFSEPASYRIDRYNFRGELIGKVELQGLPAQFAEIAPSIMVYGQERIYLVDAAALKIVVVDPGGKYLAGYAVLPQVSQTAATPKNKKVPTNVFDMTGFNVDGQGNMFFTVASLGLAFRLSPSGQLDSFGGGGSSAGQFGVVAGIALDEQGNVYLVDKLRCVVMLYGKDLNFINEFGHRGLSQADLIVPSDVAVANGKVFVSQAANRGVSVFRVQFTVGAEEPVVEQ